MSREKTVSEYLLRYDCATIKKNKYYRLWKYSKTKENASVNFNRYLELKREERNAREALSDKRRRMRSGQLYYSDKSN